MLDHISIQCADVPTSAAFYDAVLAPLGGSRVLDFEIAIGFGSPPVPDFWIGPRDTGEGFRETHIAFVAADRNAVHAFYDAAVAIGAEVLHAPRVWPEYDSSYYEAVPRVGLFDEAAAFGREVGPSVTLYLSVEPLAPAMARVEELGGTVGTVAHDMGPYVTVLCTDDQGTEFGLMATALE